MTTAWKVPVSHLLYEGAVALHGGSRKGLGLCCQPLTVKDRAWWLALVVVSYAHRQVEWRGCVRLPR